MIDAVNEAVVIGRNVVVPSFAWHGLIDEIESIAARSVRTRSSRLFHAADGRPEPDTDFDDDGVPDTIDNCAAAPDAGQQDADGDVTGDACDVVAPPPDTLQFLAARNNLPKARGDPAASRCLRTGSAVGRVSVNLVSTEGTASSAATSTAAAHRDCCGPNRTTKTHPARWSFFLERRSRRPSSRSSTMAQSSGRTVMLALEHVTAAPCSGQLAQQY